MSTEDVASYWVKPGTYYILVKNQKYYVVSASMKSMADRGGASKKKATTIKYNKKSYRCYASRKKKEARQTGSNLKVTKG